MAKNKITKKKIPELKIEAVSGRGNLLYLSLIEYKREQYLCVIDNIKQGEIGAYVIDYAEQEGIDVSSFLSLTTRWFYGRSEAVPLSIELAKRGLTGWLAPIYRTFDITYVSRIIGQPFTYEGVNKTKVRRRRVIPIPEGIEIKFKKTT